MGGHYHWRELPQVSFLSRQNTSIVTTKVCLPRQQFCRDKIMFVATNICFVATSFGRKSFVAISIVRRDKRRILSRQKIIFVAAPVNDRSAGENKWATGSLYGWGGGRVVTSGRGWGGWGHILSIAFRHPPPNSARFSYATEGALQRRGQSPPKGSGTNMTVEAT